MWRLLLSYLSTLLQTYPCCFFFNDTATTEIYTLSLHDALPISRLDEHDVAPDGCVVHPRRDPDLVLARLALGVDFGPPDERSEEHTSELQSQSNLVCRLLLEKKKKARQQPLPTHCYPARCPHWA